MVLSEVAEISGGRVITSHFNTGVEVEYAFASDLMSDVLTTDIHNLLLVTGLSNLQTIRTAEMADIFGIVLVRGKKATDEMKRLAGEHGIVIIETGWSMFRVCVALGSAGLKPVF
jgi:ribulose 1,5-bisphosphate synthetase/thiazole synthase